METMIRNTVPTTAAITIYMKFPSSYVLADDSFVVAGTDVWTLPDVVLVVAMATLNMSFPDTSSGNSDIQVPI